MLIKPTMCQPLHRGVLMGGKAELCLMGNYIVFATGLSRYLDGRLESEAKKQQGYKLVIFLYFECLSRYRRYWLGILSMYSFTMNFTSHLSHSS